MSKRKETIVTVALLTTSLTLLCGMGWFGYEVYQDRQAYLANRTELQKFSDENPSVRVHPNKDGTFYASYKRRFHYEKGAEKTEGDYLDREVLFDAKGRLIEEKAVSVYVADRIFSFLGRNYYKRIDPATQRTETWHMEAKFRFANDLDRWPHAVSYTRQDPSSMYRVHCLQDGRPIAYMGVKRDESGNAVYESRLGFAGKKPTTIVTKVPYDKFLGLGWMMPAKQKTVLKAGDVVVPIEVPPGASCIVPSLKLEPLRPEAPKKGIPL
jgi:hypothetical protein